MCRWGYVCRAWRNSGSWESIVIIIMIIVIIIIIIIIIIMVIMSVVRSGVMIGLWYGGIRSQWMHGIVGWWLFRGYSRHPRVDFCYHHGVGVRYWLVVVSVWEEHSGVALS